ncbi:MAG TPA: ABC-F family ATP-binding cassette domain-containing protein [Streptosporangiaceae bacterium]
MNLVNLESAVKAYGERELLGGVSAGVAAGEAIGVVGRNGAGKSTLLAALAGRGELDSGRVTLARSADVGYLPQAEELSGTAGQIVFGSMPEHEWAAQPRSRGVIGALLSGIDLAADAARLSGGERRRVALAALLRSPHDLLLLDEPTNHLDIEAIGWLAGHLREHADAYVVVTHDRWFLDAVCDRTWELADGQLRSYDGGYSSYVLARAERSRLAEAADQRRRALLRKELAWLRRGPPARTSKPKFRLDAAAALIDGEPPPRDGVELTRLATARLGRTVLELTDVTATAGQRLLLDNVTWQLGPGERVGVLGANGTGKSTLLRLLAGQLVPGSGAPPDSAAGPAGPLAAAGTVRRGSTVRLGYLTQEPAPADPGVRALEAAERVRRSVRLGKGEISVSQLLDRLGLRGERQWTLVGELSGGERRRLQLLTVLLGEPNVLLLDEPTNDLDTDTLAELEDLLDGWPGSLIVVSHDRYFVERVTDHVLALSAGQLAYLPGGVAEYLELRQREQADGTPPGRARPAAAGSAASASAGGAPGATRAGLRHGRSGPAEQEGDGESEDQELPVSAARRRLGRKELTRLERQLSRLSTQEAEVTESLAGSASDYEALIDLGARLRAVQREKASLEDRWLELAEELDE